MFRDYTAFLWLLKLGALANLWFLANTPSAAAAGVDACVILPAQIFFVVSAWRCLFPVRYEHNVVFHDSIFSSIFVTRLLATFSEIAYIFQFAYVLRRLDAGGAVVVVALSWVMVAQVVVSQVLVWAAILTERLEFYFFEELGWFVIFAANTMASAYLHGTVDAAGGAKTLLVLNLLFGALYLPWQVLHLRTLRVAAGIWAESSAARLRRPSTLSQGLMRALHERNRKTDAAAWGGLVGVSWMAGYWAILIPPWIDYIARTLGSHHP